MLKVVPISVFTFSVHNGNSFGFFFVSHMQYKVFNWWYEGAWMLNSCELYWEFCTKFLPCYIENEPWRSCPCSVMRTDVSTCLLRCQCNTLAFEVGEIIHFSLIFTRLLKGLTWKLELVVHLHHLIDAFSSVFHSVLNDKIPKQCQQIKCWQENWFLGVLWLSLL